MSESATSYLPDPPKFSREQLDDCERRDDYSLIFFEWFRHAGHLCHWAASVSQASPALRPIPPLHFALSTGLMHRCSRLMLATMALSHEGLFGETTAILGRCINESAIRVRWLSQDLTGDRCERLISDGLKSEIALQQTIARNVEKRDGTVLPIEGRMRASIERYLVISERSGETVAAAKQTPNLAAMLQALDEGPDLYVIGQQMGSQHIHGTWSSLLTHYLRPDENDRLVLRDHECETPANHYAFVSTMVMRAARGFTDFMFVEGDARTGLVALYDGVHDEIAALLTRLGR